MNLEFLEALGALEKERGISKDVLIEAIEAALVSAYKRNFGAKQNVSVLVDRNTGSVNVYTLKDVVEDELLEDASVQISLTDAKVINRAYLPGDVVQFEVTPKDFGRIAAQTAKQVVVQRIREAERGLIFDEFIEKEAEVLPAIVQRIEKRNVYVEMGKAEGVLTPQEFMPGEQYHINDRMHVYVLEVKRSTRGTQILVSRTHPGLVKRLFELEVPEIRSGAVQIMSISREAGYRSKMAVYAPNADIDPVGACVGQRGTRVERIVQELHGEKIDVIKYSNDPGEYIANALSPAKVLLVHINAETTSAKVIVPDNQLSLAIGKEGQNARLAARLTGWKIDITDQSRAEELLRNEVLFNEEELMFEDEPVFEATEE